MPVEARDGLRFILTPSTDLIDPFDSRTEWPRLSCTQANQLALEFGDLMVDGKVGIGTTATTEKLEVAGKIKATDLDISGAIATNQLRVTGSISAPLQLDDSLSISGNVGIGTTTTPTEKLEVVGKIKATDLDISDAIATNQLSVNGNLRLNVGEGLDFLGENNYFGSNLDARIFRMIDRNGSSGNVDGGIAIEGFTPTDQQRKLIMAIRGNGNVGIGTNSPSQKLDINGNLNVTGNILGRLTGVGITVAPSLGNEQTIKPPDGFTVEECVFFVALSFVNVDAVLKNQNTKYCKCAVDKKGKVTVIPEGDALALGIALAKKGGW